MIPVIFPEKFNRLYDGSKLFIGLNTDKFSLGRIKLRTKQKINGKHHVKYLFGKKTETNNANNAQEAPKQPKKND